MSRILLKMASAVKSEFVGCHVQVCTSDGIRHGKLYSVSHELYGRYNMVLQKHDGTLFELSMNHDSEVSVVVNT